MNKTELTEELFSIYDDINQSKRFKGQADAKHRIEWMISHVRLHKNIENQIPYILREAAAIHKDCMEVTNELERQRDAARERVRTQAA